MMLSKKMEDALNSQIALEGNASAIYLAMATWCDQQALDSQRAWVERVTYYELMNAPDYQLAFNHYFPGKLKL